MKLPILISVPHAGRVVPDEVRDLCLLTEEDVIEDGDNGALEIYGALEYEAVAFMRAEIARAIVDLNRPEDDRGPDGVVKTHTIWMQPVYNRKLTDDVVQTLIDRYWRPYHRSLSELAGHGAALGVDCHTMVDVAPPISRFTGTKRPAICVSNAGFTCPDRWLSRLASFLEGSFGLGVGINDPFKGGHIIRSHSGELPWVQIEISRGEFLSAKEKGEKFLRAIRDWCKEEFGQSEE